MSGIACQIPHLAIIRFVGIPSDPAQLPAFDAQLLECFKQSDIISGIVDAELGDEACQLLAKQSPFNADTRQRLYAIIESLYGS